MKRYLLSGLLALVMGFPAHAQQTNADGKRPRLTTVERQTQQANRMAARLQLDDKTQTWFVPLYVAYQDTLQGIRRNCRIRQQPRQVRLSDAEAVQLVESRLVNDEKRVAIRRAYYKKFSKQLNPQQLLILFGQPRMGQPGKRGRGAKACPVRCQQACFPADGVPAQRRKVRAKAARRNCPLQTPQQQTAAE